MVERRRRSRRANGPLAMPPIPVLLMSEQLSAGGTERQLVEMAKALDREKFAPHVATIKGGFRAAELTAAGVPILELPLTSFFSIDAVLAGWQLARYMRKHRIKVFHAFDFPAACFGVPVARLAGTPLVLSSQRGHRKLNPPLYQKLQRWTDPLTDGIVVNCEAMRAHLIDDEGVRREKTHLCYNGLEINRFHQGRRTRLGALSGATLVIGSLSVLRPEKGIETILEAFATVLPIDPGMRLAIVGSGPQLEDLRAIATRLNIDAACHFEPSTKETEKWLAAMDIFVLPSLSEAFSNSLMEAMASACAPVASNVGGNPELVEDGQTGMLFEASNAGQLSDCLRLLITNQDLRNRLSFRAAERVQRFSLNAAATRLGEIYTGLLNK